MDTNAVENAIRPIPLTRKNALFAGNDDGAVTWARMASLVGTCKLNGINPQVYLEHVLEKILNGHMQESIQDLVPWNSSQTRHGTHEQDQGHRTQYRVIAGTDRGAADAHGNHLLGSSSHEGHRRSRHHGAPDPGHGRLRGQRKHDKERNFRRNRHPHKRPGQDQTGEGAQLID